MILLARSAAVFAAFWLSLFVLAPESAQAQSKFNFGLGSVVPIGSSADLLNPGYNAMLSYAVQPSWVRNYLRFEVAVNALTEKATGSAKRQVLSGSANAILVGDQQRAPTGYVVLGLGMYQASVGVTRHTDPGINVGAGIRFTMGFFGTFLEARLHYVNDDTKTKFFPMTFGLAF